MRPLLLALLISAAAFAAPPNEVPGLKVPADAKGAVGDWITVQAVTDGVVVRWVPVDAGLKVFPSELLKDSKVAVVHAPRAGVYRVLAYTAIKGEPTLPAVCTVTVGDPEPPPLPPQPLDPLVKELKGVYAADPAPAELKRQTALRLATFYRDAALACADEAHATQQQLNAALKARFPDIAGVLTPLVQRMGKEIAAAFGTEADLKPAVRAAAAATFRKLAIILEGIHS